MLKDLLAPLNFLVVPWTVFQNYRRADWRGARKRGIQAVLLTALNAWHGIGQTFAFFFPVKNPGNWSASNVERLLSRYGIRTWGWSSFAGKWHFRVEQRQAEWAQYVMLRAGVPLQHGMFDGSRANPGADVTGLPSPWASQRAKATGLRGWLEALDRAFADK